MTDILKKTEIRNEAERDIVSGKATDGFKIEKIEFELHKQVDLGKSVQTYSFYQEQITMFEFEFVKSFLFGVYSGVISGHEVGVDDFFVMGSSTHPVIVPPYVSSTDENGQAIIQNDFVYAFVKSGMCRYRVSVFAKHTDGLKMSAVKFFIAVLGTDIAARNPQEVIKKIVQASIHHSVYRNKIVKMCYDGDNFLDMSIVPPDEFEDEKLEHLFVPAVTKNELVKFIKCVKTFDQHGYGLRYIFNGEPGTGKTKSVRTVIRECYGFATIIMLTGQISIRTFFELGDLMKPSILLIDDLDLFVGDRNTRYDSEKLGEFLQQLDGFQKRSMFLLTTTNDKQLVDTAASRPGRFDVILGFGKLQKENYLELIKAHCKDPEIVDLFNGRTLDVLKKKNVTGAFIVNLVKQLEVHKKIDQSTDLVAYMNDFIELSHRGFYKKNDDSESKFGFFSGN